MSRPDIVHFFYECAPLIDEHSQQRQSLLQLEKRWLTKDPWFRLVTSLVGMSVVDMHRLYRCHKIKNRGVAQQDVDLIRVLKFTDLLCGDLVPWQHKEQSTLTPTAANGDVQLERITNEKGEKDAPPTPWQMNKGRTVGNPVKVTCFICRRHLTEEGQPRREPTPSRCPTCHMPICKTSRVGDDGGRELSWLEEHLCGEDDFFRCNSLHTKGRAVPKGQQMDLNPRRSPRGATRCGATVLVEGVCRLSR